MSVIIRFRLTDDEAAAMDKIVSGNDTVGFENRSEFWRLLLFRERVRRGEKLPSQSFRTVNRGRGHELKFSQ